MIQLNVNTLSPFYSVHALAEKGRRSKPKLNVAEKVLMLFLVQTVGDMVFPLWSPKTR